MHPNVNLIAALAILSRLADVWTTYLVTPNLRLEANSIAHRLGWWYAVLTILVGLAPYYSLHIGVMVLTASFMVAAANAGKIVMARAIGEEEMAALSRRVILATPLWPGLFFLVLPGLIVSALAASLVYFYPLDTQWGHDFALGMFAYALAIFVWYPVRYLRMHITHRRSGS